jgi:translation initiation factor IF-3
VIGVAGEQLGILSTDDALSRAAAANYDLVEIAPNADPPVCRIMDYGKFKYEQSKKEKISRKRQTIIHVKEIRFRPKIENHDYEFKVKHARKFLEAGDKVKASVIFRGREMVHQEFGREVLRKMIEDLQDIAKVEHEPKMEGRILVTYLVKK